MKRQYIVEPLAILILMLFLAVACGCGQRAELSSPALPADISTAETEEYEGEASLESIFIYQDNGKNAEEGAREIDIEYSSLPQNVPPYGYVRFIGFVDDILLLEVAGAGKTFKVGDKIGVYKISSIFPDRIKLVRSSEELQCKGD